MNYALESKKPLKFKGVKLNLIYQAITATALSFGLCSAVFADSKQKQVLNVVKKYAEATSC